MDELDYRAETCSSPIGDTGDYDSWIELVTPDFNMQCYDPNVKLEQVEELSNMLNVAKNCNIHDVSNRRELLKGFASKFNDRLDRGDGVAIMDWMIDEYLEAL